ncbi:NAD-dependent epimerase/dehydratase family protein [Catenuloplanes atrovinosus]|uniref:Nucleoside-diphosphate-sugar epimerase n=1 Tax=Catenuloplanes atrovinosus TaxID=137266 RepID=A0AAE3YQG6_9ACTN|nr:NAD(P)-dependent oxidoreductase [Catenuloplanes atrovinosus]MDR7275916.1 nucleoside-diphosphate-sugar epimerase [Catenuloplanes atrovinosus]
MRVVVTGAAGLVGTAAATALDKAGWTVRGTDRAPGRWVDVPGDLRDPRIRADAVRDTDTLVHVAALHAPHLGTVPDSEFWAVNVDATAALLGEATRAGVRRIVYISSTSVYGRALVPDRSAAVWVDENLPPRPRDVYDDTKLAAERLIATGPIPHVTLRIARCFPERPHVLAGHLLYRAVGVHDVAAAIVLAAATDGATGVYNIAGPYPFTPDDCRDLHRDAPAVITARAPRVAAAFRERGWRLPASIDRVYDSRAAGSALGYRPTFGALEFLTG